MNKINKYLNEGKTEDNIRQEFIKFDKKWTSKSTNALEKEGYKKEAKKIDDFMREIDIILGKISRGF